MSRCTDSVGGMGLTGRRRICTHTERDGWEGVCCEGVCREDGEGRIPRGWFFTLCAFRSRMYLRRYHIYEMIGAADRYYMVSRAASSSIVVASLYHRFPPISLASFSRSSAEVLSVLSDDAAVLKAEETPKTRLNRLFVFLFGPADCDP